MRIKIHFMPIKKVKKTFGFTTCGHWLFKRKELNIFVATMSDWRYECAVLFHELIEALITRHQGTTTKECDKFDAWFETQYDLGLIPKSIEAGFDKRCPYRRGHIWGSRIERFVIWILGASWKEYCEETDKLMGVES